MKLGPDLYFYPWQSEKENNCNSIFLDGEVPTLIDPGHRHQLPKLYEQMRQDGIYKEKIKLIINTHAHPDHMEGSMDFPDSNVMISIHEQEEAFIKEIGPAYFAAVGMKPPSLQIDFYLSEGTLNLGSKAVEIIHTPGHSPGSISIYLPFYKLLICGDLIFLGSVGRVDIPGGDADLLKKSIQRLSKMDIEYILPGHGPLLPNGQVVKRNFAEIERVVNQML